MNTGETGEGVGAAAGAPAERSRSSPPSLGPAGSDVEAAGDGLPRPLSASSLTGVAASASRSRSLTDLLHSLPVSVGCWLRSRLSGSTSIFVCCPLFQQLRPTMVH